MSSSYSNSSSGSSSHPIDRKSLRRPDEFMKALNQFFDSLTKNYRGFSAVILGVVALTAGGVFVMNRSDSRAEQGRNELFLAQKAMDTELKAVAQANAPAKDAAVAAKDKDKDKDAKEAALKGAETVRFAKLDVDAKLPQAVAKLKTVAQQYSGTRPGLEAQFTLGNLYFSHGEAAKAAPWFQQAVDNARTAFDKGSAYLALGHAHEDSGKLAEAAQAFDKAASSGEASLKGEALMSLARVQELSKDLTKARSTYDQIISQLPSSEYAKAAELKKSQIE